MSRKPTNLVTAMATLFLLCAVAWLHADDGGDSNITSHALDGLNRFPHVHGGVHNLPNWPPGVVQLVEDGPVFSELARKILDALPIGGETAITHSCPNAQSCVYRKVSENEVAQLDCIILTIHCPDLTPSPVFKFK